MPETPGQANAPLTLADLPPRRPALIIEVHGGWGMQRRLQALGIRPGARVTKVSTGFRPGAVVVGIGGGQAALGHGIARRVIVEPLP
ncbi:MAG: ferrous iron transport protein A [Lentisphaerae bacterium]|nr:ferrous iron transport protein A [Lentisphaerota bacterium]